MRSNFFISNPIRLRVAGIIQNSKKEILFVRQMKKKHSYWLLPGGGIEYGESAVDALKRELKEELNLIVKKTDFLIFNECVGPYGQRHLIQIVFLVKIKKIKPDLEIKDKTILEFGFFSLEAIKKLEIRPDLKNYLSKGKFKINPFIKSEWIEQK